jgi:hypothetical protein
MSRTLLKITFFLVCYKSAITDLVRVPIAAFCLQLLVLEDERDHLQGLAQAHVISKDST